MNTVQEFHDHLVSQGRSDTTATSYSSDIKRFLAWHQAETGEVAVEPTQYGATATEYIQATRQTDAGNSSILRYMSALRAYCEFLQMKDPSTTAPFVGYKGPKRHHGQAHPLPGMMLDVDAMVRAAWRPHHKILIGLCGYAGLRVTEARSITPRSLFKDHKGYWWLAVHGKGGTYREVPVSDALYALLTSTTPPPTPSTPYVDIADRAARKAITEIGKRADIARGVSSHDLRHTFASHIYGATKDLRVTQELLGHSSSQTTEGYTGISAENKRDAIMATLG